MVERCLQHYMNQKEVVQALQAQCRISPSFTTLVWRKLEEQNPEFFKAYYVRLKLKDQINMFNYLLVQQVQVSEALPAGGRAGECLVGGRACLPSHAIRKVIKIILKWLASC